MVRSLRDERPSLDFEIALAVNRVKPSTLPLNLSLHLHLRPRLILRSVRNCEQKKQPEAKKVKGAPTR